MNNKFNTYIKKSGENISLTRAEREKMKGMLREYMAMKPLRTPTEVSAEISFWGFSLLRPVAAVLALAVFASSAGISYAARSALPGDVLYAIKTEVNEPLKEALAISTDAKQELAMSVAGERLKEAATLAAQGRLDENTELELRASFEEHARKASDNMGQRSETSPGRSAEAAVRFEAQLSEYERVLVEVGSAKGGSASTLASSVQAERERVSSILVRAQVRAESGTTAAKAEAVARMRDAAKKGLDDSVKLSGEVHAAFASSSAETIAQNLAHASATISAGENFLGIDAEPQALGAFQNALSDTEKIHVLLQTSSRIHKSTGLLITEPNKDGSDNNKLRKGNGNEKFPEQSKEKASLTTSTSGNSERTNNSETSTDAENSPDVNGRTSFPLVVPISSPTSSVSY
ncbi:MAG: DUF5667 domain-containing protein [bacterium]|nr:DUF5667 domain-containing protein [bacterium]